VLPLKIPPPLALAQHSLSFGVIQAHLKDCNAHPNRLFLSTGCTMAAHDTPLHGDSDAGDISGPVESAQLPCSPQTDYLTELFLAQGIGMSCSGSTSKKLCDRDH